MSDVKIAAFSDIHGALPRDIESGNDLLFIVGDISPWNDHSIDYQRQWFEFNFIPWCERQIKDGIAKDVIFVAGNHDWYLYDLMLKPNKEKKFRSRLPEHICYLRDSMIELCGLKIWGTPHQLEFCNWAFNHSEYNIDKYFKRIPEGTDIVLSHGPAFGHNDTVKGRENKKLGSQTLLKHIKRVKPKWLYTGHIHTASHVPSQIIHDDNTCTECVCVSILDEGYHVFYNVFYNTLNK